MRFLVNMNIPPYICSKLLEVFKTKARYNWGMRSSNA